MPTMTLPPRTQENATLTYCFNGVGEREQALFKSFLRLLEHRLGCRWQARAGAAEVTVSMAERAGAAGGTALVLRSARALRRVGWPLHADELEEALADLGAGLAGPAGVPAEMQGGGAAMLRLTRWPPVALLNDRASVRVAALLTGRPMAPQELARTARLPLEDCLRAVALFTEAGLVLRELPPTAAAAHPAAAAAAPSRPSPGLIARIRVRLGLGA